MFYYDPLASFFLNGKGVEKNDEKNTSRRFLVYLSPKDFLVGNQKIDGTSLPSSKNVRSLKLCGKNLPKRFLLMQQCSRKNIEGARYASAIKSQIRQRKAFENRLRNLELLRQKKIVETVYSLQVRKRRELKQSQMREAVYSKQQKGVQRAEEARKQIVEKVRKKNCQVDEVVFIKETQLMEKQILIERRLNKVRLQLKQKLAEKVSIAKKRNEAVQIAAERRDNLLKEKAERDLARAQEREEKEKRIQEMKEKGINFLVRKSEAWEEKVNQHQLVSEAGNQALRKKIADKAKQSELILKARDEKMQLKAKLQAQKLIDAQERRNRVVEINYPYRDVMASYDTGEEEVLSQRLLNAQEDSQRRFDTYSEGYQKSCTVSLKEIQKSKLKNSVTRLTSLLSYSDLVQCRPTLAEICGISFTTADHEYIRYSTALELITRILILSRKSRLVTVTKQAVETLLFLFKSENEGRNHVSYFVRSGLYTQVILAVHEEVNRMRKNSLTTSLSLLFTCIVVTMEIVCEEAEKGDPKLVSVRDLVTNEVERLELDRIYCVVLKMCLAPKDLDATYLAMRIISVTLTLHSKRKEEMSLVRYYFLVVSLFALLQNIVTAGAGNPKTPLQSCLSAGLEKFTCSQVLLIYCAVRLLNILARMRLVDFQRIFHITSTSGSPHYRTSTSLPRGTQSSTGNSTLGVAQNSRKTTKLTNCRSFSPASVDFAALISRMELSHFLRQFFKYIHAHWCDLEVIPMLPTFTADNSSAACTTTKGIFEWLTEIKENSKLCSSFSDAERFGLTLSCLPPFPSIAMMTVNKDHYCGGGSHYHLRAALHECILLVGYLCLDNTSVQEMFSWGKDKSLLEEVLTALPAPYFANARHILFPTLLCILDDNDQNLSIMRRIVDLHLIQNFFEEEQYPMSKKARQYARNRAAEIRSYRNLKEAALEKENRKPSILLNSPSDDEKKQDMEDPCNQRAETVNEEKKTSNKGIQCTRTAHLPPENDKDMLFKNLKVGAVGYDTFFKLEKRIPIGFWPLFSEKLEVILRNQ